MIVPTHRRGQRAIIVDRHDAEALMPMPFATGETSTAISPKESGIVCGT